MKDVIPIEPFSPEDLIQVFGDQAYHKALVMVVEALKAGDKESCRKLSTSARVLMARGYHKFPEAAKRLLCGAPIDGRAAEDQR